ncbi:MAG: hypothetical protein WBP67_13690, partial [Thermoanaerobaculia bacterium]
VLHSEQQVVSGEVDRARQIVEQALDLLPPAARHMWSYAIGVKILADQMSGKLARGIELVNEILNEPALLTGMSEARMMLWLCLAYWMEGDLNGLKQPASRCLKLGEQCALPESLNFGRYFLGVSHYVRNVDALKQMQQKLFAELEPGEGYRVALVDTPNASVRSLAVVTGTFEESETGRELAAIFLPNTPDPTKGSMRVVAVEDLSFTGWTVDDLTTFHLTFGSVSPKTC